MEEPVAESVEEIPETAEEPVTESAEEVPETAEEVVTETVEEVHEIVEEVEEQTEVTSSVDEEIAEEIEPEAIPEKKSGVVIEEVTEETIEEIKEEIKEEPVTEKIEEKPEVKAEEIPAKKEKKSIEIKLPQLDFKKVTKKQIIIIAAAVVVLAALISVISVLDFGGDKGYYPSIYSGRSFDDSEVSLIAISAEKQAEHIRNTEVKGDKNKFAFYANTAISVSEPDSLLPIAFSNPTINEDILLCSLVNKDGVVVYRSLGVVPGRYLTNIRLSRYLDYGVNELTLYVSAFRAEGTEDDYHFEQIGTQKAKIEVHVGNDYMSE